MIITVVPALLLLFILSEKTGQKCYSICDKNNLGATFTKLKQLSIDLCDGDSKIAISVKQVLKSDSFSFVSPCNYIEMEKYITCVCKSDIFKKIMINAKNCIMNSYFNDENCKYENQKKSVILDRYKKCRNKFLHSWQHDVHLYDYFSREINFINEIQLNKYATIFNMMIKCRIDSQFNWIWPKTSVEEDNIYYKNFVENLQKLPHDTIIKIEFNCFIRKNIKLITQNMKDPNYKHSCKNMFEINLDVKIIKIYVPYFGKGFHKYNKDEPPTYNLRLTYVISGENQDEILTQYNKPPISVNNIDSSIISKKSERVGETEIIYNNKDKTSTKHNISIMKISKQKKLNTTNKIILSDLGIKTKRKNKSTHKKEIKKKTKTNTTKTTLDMIEVRNSQISKTKTQEMSKTKISNTNFSISLSIQEGKKSNSAPDIAGFQNSENILNNSLSDIREVKFKPVIIAFDKTEFKESETILNNSSSNIEEVESKSEIITTTPKKTKLKESEPSTLNISSSNEEIKEIINYNNINLTINHEIYVNTSEMIDNDLKLINIQTEIFVNIPSLTDSTSETGKSNKTIFPHELHREENIKIPKKINIIEKIETTENDFNQTESLVDERFKLVYKIATFGGFLMIFILLIRHCGYIYFLYGGNKNVKLLRTRSFGLLVDEELL